MEIMENNNLLDIIKNNNKQAFDDTIEHMFPIDISILLEKFEDEDISKFYQFSGNELMAKILEQAEEELQIRIINILGLSSILEIFSYMEKDDIVDIIGNLSINIRKKILNMMKKSESNKVQQLLGYDINSAGGIMTTEYIALYSELTIGECLKKIKDIGPKTEVIEIIFVLNNKKELIGTADLRDILVAAENEKLHDIIDEHVISVFPETYQEEVSMLVSKYDLKVIPVVNRKNALLGIITIDDIIDVIIEESTEDILRLGGVSEEERLNTTLATSISKRLPWLFVNLITAFLAAFTVGLFEDVIAQVVALAAAMPIVAGMGGNAGTQTLSIVIRSIALGEADLAKSWKLIFKEIALGIVNGAATGLATGTILYFVYGNAYLGLIIFVAMIANLVIAGFFGFLIPLLLKSLKIDPALASSIFLTTATDVFGFFIFLGLAKVFIEFLI